jgi:hypothetical protein
MPLPIRDGNQSLTTLSTILVSNSHIPAHTVISFGTQGITDIATAVSGVELGPNTLNALENITVTLGQVTITGGLTDAQLRASAVTIGGIVTATISGTASVTFSEASVTFGTAVITGSASILNFPATQTVTFSQASVTFGQPTITGSVSILNLPATQTVTFTTAPVTFGTSVVTGSVSVLNIPATQTVTFSQASVTFGLISGTVTANPTGTQTIAGTVTANLGANSQQELENIVQESQYISGKLNSVTIGSLPSVTVGNTVTIGALPSGALTTRFGSVTTANTAQITSAVTNTSRKYLLAQNISSSAVTIGIGFSPTTTQGIQLNAGAGLTFDAFCPTGAVYWLGSVTGASFTILEG